MQNYAENGVQTRDSIEKFFGGYKPITPEARESMERIYAEHHGIDPKLDALKDDPERLRHHLDNRNIYTASHLMAMLDTGFAGIEWVLEGFLPRAMVTTLYGHGGVGKSMLALELALMLASGNDWLGFKALVDDGGAVMYVDFEMHYRVQAKRIAMIAGYAIPERFFLVNPHNLDSDSLLYRELLHYKPSLVVIDSFSAYVGGKDTTKEDVVVPAIRKLQKFAEQANCAVLIVDHVTKNDAANDATTPYGSVYKHNLVRMAWYVRDIEPNLLEITRTKNNLQDSTTVERTFQVRRRTNEHGYLWHERCAVPEGGRRGAIVRYLRTVGDVGATTKEIADYLEEEGYEVHQRTVQRDLQTMNIVIADGNARNTRYRLRNNHTEGGNHAEW